ncbi:troponin C, skeletal muscle-like [Macadamia integrifolia]|uniref:troponin C, skeletal muscle-like n=1 Tax=Macadamia integrifolia TaxID=60698 RepID=UPI001C4E67F2|nr:troponin C, skeletal muscle-like [Macadamia integrifolia]
MEDICMASTAFYEKGGTELTVLAKFTFEGVDKDGNGKISRREFKRYLSNNGYNYNKKLFKKIDTDGNKSLDFEEFKVFFYLTRKEALKSWIYKDGNCDRLNKFIEKLANVSSIGSIATGCSVM